MMILSEKNFDGTQNGTHNSNFGSEVIKSDFSNIENDEISKERRIWLKFYITSVDTVLESSNIIVFDFIILGTTLGTIT